MTNSEVIAASKASDARAPVRRETPALGVTVTGRKRKTTKED
jgi:hypothetical protein